VREPREPDEKPPPIRASAEEMASMVGSASAMTTAIALTKPPICCENLMAFFLNPKNSGNRL
jgi:hypothetical protein